MSVDPRAVQELFKDIKHATRRKYLSHWEEFLQFSGITVDNPPTAEHFMEYFVNKRENANFSGSTLFTLYSSLNSVYTALYGEKLQVRKRQILRRENQSMVFVISLSEMATLVPLFKRLRIRRVAEEGGRLHQRTDLRLLDECRQRRLLDPCQKSCPHPHILRWPTNGRRQKADL